MTMKILIKTENKTDCTNYFVHGEHERDMYDFLKNHSDKKEVINHAPKSVEWFTIPLIQHDIDFIKNTCWYKNTEWDKPQLENELNEANEIEIFLVES